MIDENGTAGTAPDSLLLQNVPPLDLLLQNVPLALASLISATIRASGGKLLDFFNKVWAFLLNAF